MGLFSSDGSNHTCPMPTTFAKQAPEPIVGNLYFYHLNMMISGACAALSDVLACDTFEQAKRANKTEMNVFFAAFEAPQKKDSSFVTGLEWFRKQWIAIFQYPVVAFGVAIATDITQAAGIYCLDSNKPYFAHLWLTIISTASIGFAVMAALNFYRTLKTYLSGHQPLAKLLAFKLIVGLSFLESIIFTILRTTNTLKSSSTLSYADANIGIPSLVICLQMVFFALFFPYAYRVSPYIGTGPYKGGFLGVRAWIGLFNPMEILHAIKFIFDMGTELRNQESSEGYLVEGEGRPLYPTVTAPPYTYQNLDSAGTSYEHSYDLRK
ncbi:hypothetical protein N7493_005823 [Penicillium malachiteum]|uniref:Transmembrane protein n=1 Tax=Penicillium malachiteum TaxID=1324776 RepID=A0AAD6HLY6_9EURO|nr:hypothetical protein N7493_005823 [Penicillium malachiteum]